MYEKISEEVVSFERFLMRVLKHGLYVLGILALSIIVGAAGFIAFEDYSFDDAILNSAHVLAGLGLLEVPDTYAGRIFAVLLGMYASLFFLAAFSVIFAPVVHRILHKMHLDDAG